jgi:hypothetical protein
MKQELVNAGFEIVSVSGWYCNLPTIKRAMNSQQKALYKQLKLLGTSMAGSIMAHLMPEQAKHYTIVAHKPR